jgi:hypothetical protein
MKWTSRKWLSAIGLSAVAFVSLWLGKLDGTQLVALMGVVWPSYFVSNVMAKKRMDELV